MTAAPRTARAGVSGGGWRSIVGIVGIVAVGWSGCAGELDDPPRDDATSSASSSSVTSGTGAGLPEGTPHVAWLVHWGARRTSERITNVVVEPGDDIVVAGAIGTFDVGEAPLLGVDAEDILLARFDQDGELLASRVLGGRAQNGARALARRDDGTFTMMGVFADTFPAFEPALETTGGPAVFAAAFDPSFESLWGRAFVGAATGRGQATMATTDDGSVVVAGTFHQTLITDEVVVPATGPSDAYVTRLSRDGATEWLVTLGGPDVLHLEIGAATSVGEDVIVAGQLRGTLRSASGVDLAESGDALRAFLARFDETGAITSFRTLESDGSATVTRLVPRQGGLLAAAVFAGAVSTQAGDVVSAGEGDASLLWLDGAGAPLFGRTWGDMRSQQIASLALDPAGTILATGSFTGTLDFGDAFYKTDDGRPDGFAVVLSPTGVARRSVVATDVPPAEGTNTSSQGTSVAAWLSTGDIVACGNFGGTMRLGDAVAQSAGDLDAFVARVELR